MEELASLEQKIYLENLLETSYIGMSLEIYIVRNIDYFSVIEIENYIELLKSNQREEILGGFNYNQGDIKRELQKISNN